MDDMEQRLDKIAQENNWNIEKRQDMTFITATPEEARDLLGKQAREDGTIAGRGVRREEQVTWCMHCGRSLTTTTYQGVMQVTHPTWVDAHTGELRPSAQLVMDQATFYSPQEMGLAIGKWIRTIHPTETPVPVQLTPLQPAYTEAKADPHLLKSLQPLLGPHLQAIGVALHITEALGEMQQWTVTSEEDCGFAVEMTFRVTQTGDCFRDIRERRHVSGSDVHHDTPESSDHRHTDRESVVSSVSDSPVVDGMETTESTSSPDQ